MTEQTPENIAQTVAQLVEKYGEVEELANTDELTLFSVPKGREIKDLTAEVRKHAEYLQPTVRRGTAKLGSIDSLILWANRFKGAESVLYATPPKGEAGLTLTAIADYHGAGAPQLPDLTARHARHRAVYEFPLSDKWLRWKKVSGSGLSGIEMGQFLEDNILDVIDPPLSLTLPGAAGAEATEAELRLIDIANRLDGKFGSALQLLGMAKSFTVNEQADYTVAHNSQTGEQTIQIKAEHLDGQGQPIRPPKLFLVAIPVFEGGPAYRLPVRFQYRKAGASVKFILTLHDPKAAIDHAFTEATLRATAETGLPLFLGTPEA